MIRRLRAGAGTVVVGLAVAVIAAGSATAVVPVESLDVHARLAPIAGTNATGRFTGLLVRRRLRQITPGGSLAAPTPSQWQLTWSLRLPKLEGHATASLRIRSGGNSARATHVLCTRCATRATGTMALSARQVTSIGKGDAVIVVRTRSAKLRGSVKS
jgi:hypothetical protein